MKRFRWLVVISMVISGFMGLSPSLASADSFCGSHKQYEAVRLNNGDAGGTQYATISISGDHASWTIRSGYKQCSYDVQDNFGNNYSGGHTVRSFTTPEKDPIDYVEVYVARAYVVSISQSATAIKLHSAVTFTGTVTPHSSGATVYLQRLTSSGWANTAHTTLDKYGHYRFRIVPSSRATYKYRVHKPGNSAYLFGDSRTVSVSVS